jgi:hypothetical protein
MHSSQSKDQIDIESHHRNLSYESAALVELLGLLTQAWLERRNPPSKKPVRKTYPRKSSTKDALVKTIVWVLLVAFISSFVSVLFIGANISTSLAFITLTAGLIISLVLLARSP